MLLTIDIGNTQTAIGLFDQNELVGDWRTATDKDRTSDELAVQLSGLLEFSGRRLGDVSAVCLASVVPAAGMAAIDMVERYTNSRLLIVEPEVESGLVIDYEHPESVGADRVANAAAGFALAGGPLVIVDFGTATTFDVISEDGTYLGGAIAPGLATGAEALFRSAAGLKGVSLEAPDRYIGRDTATSLRTGIIFGTAAMVDGIVSGIRLELGVVCSVIGTGGLVELVGEYCQTIDRIEPLLTLYGLKRIWDLNT
jgi:type III pantothenate kinase